ncbi:MAG: response regulator transcription factor [Planctomycetota bacterium]|jgi:two-component system response regulator VicR
MPERILIIEDDAHLAAGLRYNLERAGYAVSHAANGPDGLQSARDLRPDLIVLDLMLPGLDGFDLLGTLRDEGVRTPVIILSAKDAEVDKIRGFDTGADDYVSKPFGMGELLARIRARLRGGDGAVEEETVFGMGGGTVRLETMVFERDGGTVPLTPTEVDVLRLLYGRVGKPVRREDLLKEVWGVAAASTRTLDTHVTRLRKKLERDPGRPEHIVTVHGVGYRLVL